jgi:solute carrier family 25 (adenine nucleotide translocator) protein 4/5/6/31
VKGLYRGFGPSVAGIIIYRAGYFGFYDAGKQMTGLDGANANFFLKFGLAMVVDISAAVFAYPIDTVRRRLMMQAGEATQQFTTTSSAVKHIMSTEGVGGFYKGCMANNVRAIASALVLVTYDELKKFI